MKKLVAIVLSLSIAHLCLAQVKIITWLKPGVTPQQMVSLFPVTLTDFSTDGPFALYTPLPGFNGEVIEASMVASGLVVLAEDDMETEAPENKGAGKGGTIGAVFDPNALRDENKGLLTQINARVRMTGLSLRSIRVGVLDTGVPMTNLYIRSRVDAGLAIAPDRTDWFDMPSGADTNGNGTVDDALGHGSMVSGILLQMAPQSRLVVARVADSDGIATSWSIIKGLAFVCSRNCEVVNISLGSVDEIPALRDIIEQWVLPQGILIVAPAGNNSWQGANEPAKSSSVLCVSGVDENDIKAPFSNWDSRSSQTAPAVGIKSAWWDNTIGIWSGTSFSAPLVAGSIADSLRFKPKLNNSTNVQNLMDLVKANGDNVDGKNPAYAGKLGRRLNVAKLVLAIIRM